MFIDLNKQNISSMHRLVLFLLKRDQDTRQYTHTNVTERHEGVVVFSSIIN